MAKKKKKDEELDEVQSTESTTDGSTEGVGDAPVLSKKFGKLSDFKAKITFKDVKYKKQDWINMSPAFKEVTKLPGLPIGHVIMNYGKSDTGKSTMGLEAAANAQKQNILPIFIITENKFSYKRGETMGINFDDAIVHNGVATIEEGCKYVKEILDAQEKGECPYDVLFIWDSIGGTPSEKELSKKEDGESGGGMMVTARVLREEITRYIGPRINATRNEAYPYNATMLIINHAYTAPPKMPGGPPSLEAYGGDGIYYVSTLVFRTGGIMGRSSKVTATKAGDEFAFALKTDLVVQKNHITNVSTTKGKILCTDHGFILDDKDAIAEYKKEHADGWDLKYDAYWDAVGED
jgi:RecA/RadA recombinase